MPIRFNDEYNDYIRKVVRNYNKRQKRMKEAGLKHIPDKVMIKDLKRRYNTRSELNKELNRLKNVKSINVGTKRSLKSGLNVYKWEYNYLKTNIDKAKDYFNEEYERVSKRVAKYPGERQYLRNIQAKINLLNKDITQLQEADYRSAVRSVNEYTQSANQREAQYRGFLSELDWVMEKLDYSDEQRNKLFKKFSQLTPSQFLYAYDNNDIIGRIYRLYHKNYNEEEAHLTDTEENAEELIDSLLEQADDIIKDAKDNVD